MIPNPEVPDERVVVARITKPCECPFRRSTTEYDICTRLSSGTWIYLCISDEEFPSACDLKKVADTDVPLNELQRKC